MEPEWKTELQNQKEPARPNCQGSGGHRVGRDSRVSPDRLAQDLSHVLKGDSSYTYRKYGTIGKVGR